MSAGNNVIGEVAAAMVGTQDFIFTIIISSCNADFEQFEKQKKLSNEVQNNNINIGKYVSNQYYR